MNAVKEYFLRKLFMAVELFQVRLEVHNLSHNLHQKNLPPLVKPATIHQALQSLRAKDCF